MKKIISILFVLAALCTTAFAASGTVYDINTDAGMVTISGTAAANENVLVVLLKPSDVADSDNADNVAAMADKEFFTDVKAKLETILKSGDTAINEVNFDSYKRHFTHVAADENGSFSITLPVAPEADDMVYLLVTSGGSYESDYEAISVYVPSTATIASAEAAVNGATEETLSAIIDANDYVFGLDTANDVYRTMKEEVAAAIIVMNGGEDYAADKFTDVEDENSFKSHYNTALAYYAKQLEALDKINNSTVDMLKDVLEEYSQDVNVLGFYGQEKLDFATPYTRFGHLEVNRLLVGYTYDSMEAFIEAFNAAVAELRAAAENPQQGTVENPTRPSGPSGGGGGGGGGGGSMYVPTTQVPVPEGAEGFGFSDLDQAAWAEESILNLVNRGVVNGMGDGTFQPNGFVTREQFVKMLLMSFGIEITGAGSSFADVDASAWYAPYVAEAYNLGVVNGVSDTEFGVGMPITRQDLVTMIIRICDAYGLEISKTQSVSFTDEGDIADYAYDAVMDLAAAGIINGVSDGVFAPRDNTTRAQVAVILDRLYNV